MEYNVRTYYYEKTNLDNVKIEKTQIYADSIEDAFAVFIPKELDGYIILNWVISEK